MIKLAVTTTSSAIWHDLICLRDSRVCSVGDQQQDQLLTQY
jgi:hypothetical protein